MVRLIVFRRLICPSTGPVLHGNDNAARPGRRRVSAATVADPALNRPQLPAEALLLDFAPQLGGVVAALVPAPIEVLGVTIHRVAAGLLAPGRQLSRPQPPLHRLAVGAHGTRDAPHRPALAMQLHRFVEPVSPDSVPVKGMGLTGVSKTWGRWLACLGLIGLADA